jgi:hypothetical protein
VRARDKGGTGDARAYEKCLTDSVAEVVRRQKQAGIDIVNDGEFGKSTSWALYALKRVSGFESTLTLKQEGTKLSGQLKSEMGEGELSGSADDTAVRFTIVAQFQGQRFEFKFEGKADGADRLTGTLETPFGKPLEVEAKRAPRGARKQEASR